MTEYEEKTLEYLEHILCVLESMLDDSRRARVKIEDAVQNTDTVSDAKVNA